jgi:hypothetical protein
MRGLLPIPYDYEFVATYSHPLEQISIPSAIFGEVIFTRVDEEIFTFYSAYKLRGHMTPAGRLKRYKNPAKPRYHKMLYWASECQVCGAWFVIRTAATSQPESNHRFGQRTCYRHHPSRAVALHLARIAHYRPDELREEWERIKAEMLASEKVDNLQPP